MRIGIIGAGNIGQAAAERLVAAGHEVMLSNSRGPDSLAGVVAGLGDGASAGTTDEAAAFGEVVLVATPLAALDALPTDALSGKVLIDANNYYPGRDGQIEELDRDEVASSELLARAAPDARVVKAMNTLQAAKLLHGSRPAGAGDRIALPIAGDDEAAKTTVTQLLDDMGFDAVDAGSLAESHLQEPGTPVYGAALSADDLREALRASA